MELGIVECVDGRDDKCVSRVCFEVGQRLCREEGGGGESILGGVNTRGGQY